MKNILFICLSLVYFFTFSQKKEMNNDIFYGNTLWLKSEISGTLNTHASINLNKVDVINKSVLGKKNSIFAVYTSKVKSSDNSRNILSFNSGKNVLDLNSKNIYYDQMNVKYKNQSLVGNILSVRFYDKHYKNGNIVLNKDYDDSDNRLYEVLVFPKRVNDKNKKMIETYLSIKYGISLFVDKNYYNSSYQKIWDAKKNKEFSYDVTGIGLDASLGLNQMVSTNINDDTLKIGFDDIKNVKDKDFLLIGHNDKPLSYKEFSQDKSLYVLERRWKVNQSSKKIYVNKKTYTLSFKKEDSTHIYKLLLDKNMNPDFDNPMIINSTYETKTEAIFKNVVLENEDYFTFAKADRLPAQDFKLEVLPNPVPKDGMLKVHLLLKEPKSVDFTLTDLLGKILYTDNIKIEKSFDFNYKLPKTGVYFISISIDGKVSTTKIISE